MASRGTVWYSLSPGNAERLILTLHAQGDLDASMAVVRRVRSETDVVGCKATNNKGTAVLPLQVTKGATYLVVVGQREESAPGDFSLQVLRGQPREVAPGKLLQAGESRGRPSTASRTSTTSTGRDKPGTTYRIAFRPAHVSR